MTRFVNQIKDMEIITSPNIDTVKPQKQIKVQGYLLNGKANFDNQINATSSTIGGLFYFVYKYKKIMTQLASKSFV